jgi:hypothetical protein
VLKKSRNDSFLDFAVFVVLLIRTGYGFFCDAKHQISFRGTSVKRTSRFLEHAVVLSDGVFMMLQFIFADVFSEGDVESFENVVSAEYYVWEVSVWGGH